MSNDKFKRIVLLVPRQAGSDQLGYLKFTLRNVTRLDVINTVEKRLSGIALFPRAEAEAEAEAEAAGSFELPLLEYVQLAEDGEYVVLLASAAGGVPLGDQVRGCPPPSPSGHSSHVWRWRGQVAPEPPGGACDCR